jgi:hypothetical protein
MHWKERFGELKYGLGTILAKIMPNLAPSLGLYRAKPTGLSPLALSHPTLARDRQWDSLTG